MISNKNIKEVLIWGLYRSGNHALGSFISRHNREFDSNVSPRDEYKILKRNQTYLNDYMGYGEIKDKIPIPMPKFGHIQIISFENAGHKTSRYPEYTDILSNKQLINFDTGRDFKKYIFIILRDPFNWFASYFGNREIVRRNSYYGDVEKEKKYLIDMWMLYAKNFFIGFNEDSFWFPVNYNLLCKSEEYRKSISKYIDEPFIDEGINIMYSTPSTFDWRKYQYNCLDMDLENRWRKINSRDFKLLENEELRDLSKKIFDFTID